jgi:hypothetical protein
LAVREDDAEPELLEEESTVLADGEMVAMAVKDSPLPWQTYSDLLVTLSEGGALATHTCADYTTTQMDSRYSLTTTGIELTEGKHYWEVELLSDVACAMIGISRPNLDPLGDLGFLSEHRWLVHMC